MLFCLTDGKPVVGALDEAPTFRHAQGAVKKLSAAGIEPPTIDPNTCSNARRTPAESPQFAPRSSVSTVE